MDWQYAKIQVRCPYYETHTPEWAKTYTVGCQKLPSLMADCSMQIRFKSARERDDWMRKVCMQGYYACPLFKYICEEEMERDEKDKRERSCTAAEGRKQKIKRRAKIRNAQKDSCAPEV